MLRRAPVKLSLALLALAGLAASPIYGHFRAATANQGSRFEAAPDLTPPAVEAATVEKYQGGVAGYVGAEARLYAYAQVSDAGDPPSGVAAVTADLGAAASPFELEAGSWTIAGGGYDFGSEEQTVSLAGADPGAQPFSVPVVDVAGNAASGGGFEFEYDPVAPQPGVVALANGTGTAGVPDQGDTIAFSVDSPVDPASLLGDWESAPGQRFPHTWDGSPRPATVRFLAPSAYGSESPDEDPVQVTVDDGGGPELGEPINLGTMGLDAEAWGVDCEARFLDSTVETTGGDSEIVVTLGVAEPGSILTEPPLSPEGCSVVGEEGVAFDEYPSFLLPSDLITDYAGNRLELGPEPELAVEGGF